MREILKKLGMESNLKHSEEYFINRINNIIFHTGEIFFNWDQIEEITTEFRVNAGVKYYQGVYLNFYFESQKPLDLDFKNYLLNLQILLNILSIEQSEILSKHIVNAFNLAPVDLGYNIQKINDEYILLVSGSKLLDEKLIDDILNILNSLDKMNIFKPYEKGLKEFLESRSNKEKQKNVVRDMYESLEALAKYICNNGKDLSANRDLFLSKIKVNDFYKKILGTYIDFSNKEFRHSPKKDIIELTEKEVESFIYFTGIFIRLALK